MKSKNSFESGMVKTLGTRFEMEPYVFCDENLSDYEKTIYILAIAYGASPIYRLSKMDIEELSLWLEANFELLPILQRLLKS